MADPKLTVTAKAEKASGAKAKAQEAAAKEIEKKQREAAKKAEEVRAEEARIAAEKEAARKKAEEERKAAKEAAEKAAAEAEAARKAAEEAATQAAAEEARRKEERKQQAAKTAAAGAALAAGAYQKAKSAGVIAKLTKSFAGGLILGAAIGIAGGILCGFLLFRGASQPQEPVVVTPAMVAETVAPVVEADVTIDNDGALGYTAADFQNAVLGGASEHQELIVFEQELSIPTTLTKSGLGNLAIFSKMKNITYYGTGVYTVDLSRMDSDHILVDEDDQVVTILIPHTVLQYVNAELEKTEFEETDKGLLSFGDIKLTPEETGILETAVLSAMRERLDAPDMYAEADRFATLKTWEIFQPLITAVSPAYKVEMVFE